MTEANSPFTADVCVVGAGPAGLVTALALNDEGRSVLLLESGGSDSSASARELNDGETVGEPYSGLLATRDRRLGGTVNLWNVEMGTEPGAKYVPLSPGDLASWPMDFADLQPWYDRAQEICGLGPFAYGSESWAAPARHPFDLAGTGLYSGVYQFGPARRFTHDLVAELQRRVGVRVAADSTVIGLEESPSGDSIQSVHVASAGGGATVVRSRSVVLACGAVENARLLMLAGLAPGTEWLGRGFMEHARDFSLVVEPFDRGVFRRAGFYDLHTGTGGTVVGGRLALAAEAIAQHDLLNASITLVPFPRLIMGDGLIAQARRWVMSRAGRYFTGRYGWSAIPAAERVFETFGLVVNLEQLPRRENRISLSDRRDRFGNPLPRLHLTWSQGEQEKLERFRRLLAAWLEEAGIGRLRVVGDRRPDLSAHHHAGTTRMGSDPRDGVVDANGGVHGCANLFVAGASVFPTAGFANPTLTIVAMALRLAAHIHRDLG